MIKGRLKGDFPVTIALKGANGVLLKRVSYLHFKVCIQKAYSTNVFLFWVNTYSTNITRLKLVTN